MFSSITVTVCKHTHPNRLLYQCRADVECGPSTFLPSTSCMFSFITYPLINILRTKQNPEAITNVIAIAAMLSTNFCRYSPTDIAKYRTNIIQY